MSAETVLEVQKAIYAKLSGDGTLMGLVTGVYDRVKEHTAYPYVVMGEIAARDAATISAPLQELAVGLEVFGREGRKQVLEIAARIGTLLHDGSLTISGHTLAMMRVEAVASEKLADGLTYVVRVNAQLMVI